MGKKHLEHTERKTRDQIRLSAQQWRATFDAMHEAVAVLDTEMKILRCNKALAGLIGKPWHRIIGQPCCQLVHALTEPPSSCPVLRASHTLHRETWQTLIGERWFDLVADPIFDPNGRLTGFVHVIADITEKKHAEEELAASEQRYRALFEGSAEGILVADVQSHAFQYANPAICRMLGYDAGELLQLRVEDIHPEESRPQVLAAFNAQSRGEMTLAFGLPCLRKDGNIIQVNVNSARVEINKRPFLVGFFTDVTERVRLEAERKELESQFLQAQKMEAVGRLAGGVAHDFNNMISVILGRTEMALTMVETKDPLHDELQEILAAAKRSADITRQLLAFARKQVIDPVVMNLNDTIEGILKMLRRLIGEDIDLAWKPDENIWSVKMDPAQTDQILANLCVNARDAISGTGRITIETGNKVLDEAYCARHSGFKPGEYALLAVSDDGCGMDKETLANVFEPFFTTKEMDRGTGLGLSTVYGIVKQNMGFINVYSEQGRGTTFRIYLPRHTGEAEARSEETPYPIPQGRGETILVVEDEVSVLEAGKGLLEKLGYTVLAAGTPGEAMEAVHNHPGEIHLLMTDVIMPEMNGKDLAERILKVRPNIKVLFMSGYTDHAIFHRGELDKDVHFIQKPFTFDALASEVDHALNGESHFKKEDQ